MRDQKPLAELVWSFRPPRRRAPRGYPEMPSVTDESKQLAKELKRQGFAFVGPTTVYSTMQAVGVVNDHLAGCFCPQRGRGGPTGRAATFPSR